MYQVIKLGKLLGEFHFYSTALLIRDLLGGSVWYNGPKGLERLQ